MKMPLNYQQLIDARGFSLSNLGVDDIALSREDALIAVDLLMASSVPILGGDVYIRTANRIELAYADWHADLQEGECRDDFASRSCLEAKRFITGYPMSDSIPLFSLVLDV